MLGVDWHDDRLFDLVLDTTELTEDACVATIVHAALERSATPDDGEARRRAAGKR
jgi:cytidylate kinase